MHFVIEHSVRQAHRAIPGYMTETGGGCTTPIDAASVEEAARSFAAMAGWTGVTGLYDLFHEADKRYGYVLVFEKSDGKWWLHGGSRYSPEVEVYPDHDDLA